jgi:uncharacterized low-complexity protein
MRLRAFVAAAVLAVAAPAVAQTDQPSDQPAPEQGQRHAMSPEAREAMRKACAADIQTYCSDAEKGGARLGRCLRQNFDKLNGDCQTQLKSMRAHWRQDQSPQQPQ